MSRCCAVWLRSVGLLVILASSAFAAPPTTRPVDGLHDNSPAVHALTNVRLVVHSDRTLEKGTLVIRDGVIVSVGADVAIPGDARVWDLSGKTIYPGLIDSYAEQAATLPTGGAAHWNSSITPQLSIAEQYAADATANEKFRTQGIVARLVAPANGIVKGESALVTTGKEAGERAILRASVALHLRLGVSRGRGRDAYPGSPMGAVALARQTMLDASWYAKAWAAYRANGNLPRPENNDALAAMQPYLDGQRLVLIDAANELYLFRADAFAREFSLRAAIRGSGQEYQRLDAVRTSGRTVIVPVNFPRPPNVNSPEAARDVELSDLLHWDIAPENPARLDQAGVPIALTSNGLRDANEFLDAVRKAVERGLSTTAALRALTTTPAELFGVADRLGTLESGKAASFVVSDGDLFVKKTKVVETWIDGQRYEIQKATAVDIRGQWQVTTNLPEAQVKAVELKISGSQIKPEGVLRVTKPDGKSDEVKLNKIELSDTRLTAVFDSKAFGKEGFAQLSVTIIAPREGDRQLSGKIVWPDGTQANFSATRTSTAVEADRPADQPPEKPDAKPPAETKPDPTKAKAKKKSAKKAPTAVEAPKSEAPKKEPPTTEAPKDPDKPKPESSVDEPAEPEGKKEEPAKTDPPMPEPPKSEVPKKELPKKDLPKPAEPAEPAEPPKPEKPDEPKGTAKEDDAKGKSDKDKPEKTEKPVKPKIDPRASFSVNYPLNAFGRKSPPAQPKQIVFTNATIWTCGSAGVLEKASLLVSDGKIVAVGTDIQVPKDAQLVDLAGKHISPGIIDCHSHMATDGGVNESTQAITAEVRVGDFIDCNDIDIYRQLAGGVTSANILHGSANPIGGQNQVIKLRWGELPEAMKFSEAPPGVKFALGENPKQSNWGDNYTSRYPQSRMGVEQIIRDAFQAAQQYKQSWQRWERSHDTLPPRRDLELEAVLEIVEGKRWIHCHSYRQDEILALLRTCEEFNIRIATLQHILEGYKVADAMARHGAMGSAFSDWWAYKFEVYDAIPYAGALMHNAGVVVSFNSDDQELARHLNHEAAKAMKYGSVPAEEALKFVTLNPAKQLRIDAYVGSIEVGKHADFVVWSGPPLSVLSRCEQTWIDGRKFFDLAEDKQQRDEANKMRTTLVQKILGSGETMRTPEESKKPDEELWPREDIFCRRRGMK
jgi:imidazolonepropionase-like amidohydrolase